MTNSELNSDVKEQAARALCRLYGNDEESPFEGQPIWRSFLMDVDVVLDVVLEALTPDSHGQYRVPPPR